METCQNTVLKPACAANSVGAANSLFLELIQALVVAHCNISPSDMWPADYGPTVLAQGLQEYDFIVVGAGSAGSVVAGRLSENPKWKILLLEAGGDPPIESEIPGASRSLQKTKYDWEFYIETEVICKAMNGRCYAPRGKMLGGCSGINSMLYIRGDKSDFDTWGKLGNTGWDYKSLLPYFKKSEGNQYAPFVEYENGTYHSSSGPLKVDFFSDDLLDDCRKIFLDAAIERGNKKVIDFNRGSLTGYGIAQGTYSKGRRQSTAKAYLIPAKNRTNLHIVKNAFAQKILINSNNTAYGVEFELNGTIFKAIARKEVIVSGGAYMSPHLLLLSGIGPKEDLKKLNIPVKSDIPVGRNLVDHHAVFVWFKFNGTEESSTQRLDNIYRYAIHNEGQYASIGLPQLNGFLKENGSSNPDYHIFVTHYNQKVSNLKEYMDFVGYRDDIQKKLLDENQKHNIAGLAVVKIHPLSRGYVKLANTSPKTKPIVNPRYFTHEEDITSTILAIKEQISYTTTQSYRKHGAEFIHIPIKECDCFPFLSHKYLRCYIEFFGTTDSHPTSSCKMGPKSDKDAVVDDRLRVKNIKNLRVIDASIMPYIVSSNTNSATIMIGEKGSDLIKEDHGYN